MKQLTEREWRNVKNAWGGYDDVWVQHFRITKGEVGQKMLNYLGYHHGSYTFTKTDVGRTIVMTGDDSSWHCWSFKP